MRLISKEEELRKSLIDTSFLLQKSYGYKKDEILNLITSKEYIPASIFHPKLSPLQALVKYLKQEKNLSLNSISKKIKRNYRAVWGAHSEAKKLNITFEINTDFLFPLSIFNDKFSVSESVILYLKKNYELRFSQIAKIFHRDEKTIWTIYRRAIKKNEK